MSDDLIEEARHIIEGSGPYDVTLSKKQANALLARIGELESTCYRLTEERDRLKGWADKYHDEVLELRDRLATAEADALEVAAKIADECMHMPARPAWTYEQVVAGEEIAACIRAYKPKGQE